MRERAIRTGPGRRCTGRTIAGSDSQDSIIVVGSVPQSLGVSEKLAAASAACVRRWQREEDVDDATELVSSTNHRSLALIIREGCRVACRSSCVDLRLAC
jgi:hypothetical protein